jgi:hypothetical protein
MAAKNIDSQRIFDSYIEKYLKEQTFLPKDEALKSVEDRKNRIQQQQDSINATARAANSGTPSPTQAPANPASTATSFSVPAATNKDPIQMGGQGTATSNPNMAVPSSSSTATKQGNAATGPITDEEKNLFKKLHGSDYSPGVGDQRLAELRSAVQQAGGATDVSKIANLAYAQQYAGSSQGDAYAKKAGITPIRPGEIKTPTPAGSSSTQVAGASQGTAPAPAQQSTSQTATPTSGGTVQTLISQLQSLTPTEKEELKKYLG